MLRLWSFQGRFRDDAPFVEVRVVLGTGRADVFSAFVKAPLRTFAYNFLAAKQNSAQAHGFKEGARLANSPMDFTRGLHRARLEICRRYAAQHGCSVKAALDDRGLSGFGTNRPCCKAPLAQSRRSSSRPFGAEVDAPDRSRRIPAVKLRPDAHGIRDATDLTVHRRRVGDLEALLVNPELARGAMELIRSLIEAIELTPDVAGGMAVLLRGDLARVLTLCTLADQEGRAPMAANVKTPALGETGFLMSLGS
jgi:hypothetical protein